MKYWNQLVKWWNQRRARKVAAMLDKPVRIKVEDVPYAPIDPSLNDDVPAKDPWNF